MNFAMKCFNTLKSIFCYLPTTLHPQLLLFNFLWIWSLSQYISLTFESLISSSLKGIYILAVTVTNHNKCQKVPDALAKITQANWIHISMKKSLKNQYSGETYSAENAKDIHCMAIAPREKLTSVQSHAKIQDNK